MVLILKETALEYYMQENKRAVKILLGGMSTCHEPDQEAFRSHSHTLHGKGLWGAQEQAAPDLVSEVRT